MSEVHTIKKIGGPAEETISLDVAVDDDHAPACSQRLRYLFCSNPYIRQARFIGRRPLLPCYELADGVGGVAVYLYIGLSTSGGLRPCPECGAEAALPNIVTEAPE